ncbi:MAG TPA: ChaB family protein [Mycobacteriales bacterium]
MPIMTRQGRVRQDELPSTIARSDARAIRTFAEAHDSALEQYGEEARAHRVAYAALKHTHEKIGDHWQPKAGRRRGPSDQRAAGPRNVPGRTAGGVDANAPKEHLYQVAKRLDVPGRSRMSKPQLVRAIEKANTRATAASRRRG